MINKILIIQIPILAVIVLAETLDMEQVAGLILVALGKIGRQLKRLHNH
jgi:uncharacterized membrane protein